MDKRLICLLLTATLPSGCAPLSPISSSVSNEKHLLLRPTTGLDADRTSTARPFLAGAPPGATPLPTPSASQLPLGSTRGGGRTASIDPAQKSYATGASSGSVAAAVGMREDEAAALGVGMGLLMGAIVYSIAKHQADERQREIAERNARRAYAAHQAELRRQKTRYIAVQTSRSQDSTGSTSCMVWDTRNERLVGNTVYDTKTPPPPGSTAKFDNYSAEYVSM